VHPLQLCSPPQDYPPLYVLRPDGSTLYTYRDVVYSFKKAASADLVLNIICSEQDLAQQKVALAMAMLNPAMTGRQYHVSYDLVRLPSGRMSGRRGRYLLADDLYDELKARGTHLALGCFVSFPSFPPRVVVISFSCTTSVKP
jgi:arginyl-tRNA synthetase